MAQPIRQSDTHFDLQQEPSVHELELLKVKSARSFRIATTIALLIAAASLIYVFSTIGLVKDGLYYRQEIMSKEMLPFWRELAEEQENKNTTALIEEGEHKITRQELGRMGWTLLHMMTGSFPEEITPELRDKWNTFIILFGQFYPCKLCSSHFLRMQKELPPFNGTKKIELMTYLCDMHNRVNIRLGKPVHDCAKVKQQWNTCGCREA